MNQTFVCCTSYHIYISILEAFKYKKQGSKCFLVFITDKVKDSDQMIAILKRVAVFDFIVPIKAYVITDNMVKKMGLLNFLLRRSKGLVSAFEKENPELMNHVQFFNDSEFNLFMTNRSRAYFLIKYPNAFMRIHEDGLASYTSRVSHFKAFIRKYILRFPILKGYDEQVKEFWVQQPEKFTNKVLKKKLKKLDLQALEDNISQNQKSLIIHEFLNDVKFLNSEDRALIITQPFSEIGMMSEQKKIEIYQDFIQAATDENLTIFLKAHPSERTNYSTVFANDVIVLPAVFPLEVLNLSQEFSFKKAYTVHSSALGNLKYVDEKIFSNSLGDNNYKQ